MSSRQASVAIVTRLATIREDVDVDRDIDGCCIVELVWYVSQLMYIHHKNYVFQKRWSKNRYSTYMNIYDTLPQSNLFYNIHMDPIYESQPSWIESHSMLSLIMCIQYTSSYMPFLFNATQAISLTMTIYSWLWVDKILSPEGCYHILTGVGAYPVVHPSVEVTRKNMTNGVPISTFSYHISDSYNLYHWVKMQGQDADTEMGLHRIVIITGSSIQYNTVRGNPYITLARNSLLVSHNSPSNNDWSKAYLLLFKNNPAIFQV
ncbi:hypothetical protein BDB01DRAFT_893437 [Pilobolus umbonatus]|nr:hypothetical protein BDB01DRAFT_893437 [Pilobolus umbonatus]